MGAKPKKKSDQKTEEKPTKQAISSAPPDLTSPQEDEIHHFPFQKKNFKLSLALKMTLAFIFSGLLISLVFQLLSIKSTILRGIIPEMMILCLAPVLYFYCRHITQSLLQRNALLEQNDIKNQRINNIYHIITQVNHAVLRERSQEQLLYETCKIAQKSSDYTFVWAGICDDVTNLPEIIVSFGESHSYVEKLLESYTQASALERQEPSLAVLRKKHSVVINDIVNFSKNPQSWQTRALEYGYHAIAAFDLKTSSGLNGLIAFYSKEKDAFSQEEVYLLRALVADINLGLSEIEQKDKLVYAANFDVATNLPTQSLFLDRLSQAIARTKYENRQVALAIVKPASILINEESSEDLEQEVLRKTAVHLMQLVGEGDTVGFIGKDEIGMLLTDIGTEGDLTNVMARLLSPFKMNNDEINLRAGVAIFPKDTKEAKELLPFAREALAQYEEASDLNCHFYSKELTQELRNNQRIKNEMNSALMQEEFVLCFQPVVELQSKKILGLEVLTRWPNQKLGDVSPNQFFGVAEETGLVIPLGNWILKSACEQFMQWINQGHSSLFLCVNISIKQLEDPVFVENVEKILREVKLDPKCHKLSFEIKEQCFANNYQVIKETLANLRNLGIKIFLDDFTKDAQLMGEIHQFEIDALKIDAMTVRTINKNPNTDLLLRGIMAYAKGLNIQIFAEGIETQEQLDFLKDIGCQLGQGYYFNPPLKVKNIQELLNKPLE